MSPEDDVTQLADQAYEAIRGLNHATITTAYPAPTVYNVLGNLSHAGGHGLQQALTQIAGGLRRSLEEYDVHQDDGSDPAIAVEEAAQHLQQASELAREVGRLIDQAQAAISRQSYRPQDGAE
ncbi:hypothetical protein EXU48_23920 [Occultella glacieicola]|uniref:ESX-1 secretion-associated protein n=1 Tax=Occultella glacieicola TaxID=2518684 RepID=A0ABY2DXL5_9MICO|nr:hypothetical protein [Occultella glacieicola]TDE88171.1 hypothetical protein EXU48_23920 [Occultella glacieicola]